LMNSSCLIAFNNLLLSSVVTLLGRYWSVFLSVENSPSTRKNSHTRTVGVFFFW
jgi:hypothetical protein